MDMQEDKIPEGKSESKASLAKRFFRWVFVAVKWLFVLLLALLLIGGLYFQAPPKVLTLIVIILATLTIIPKRARKWIGLTFGIVVIALVVWVFLPEDDSDWRPYTFDKELAALEAKRAIPDEENAATIYNKLIEIYDSNDFKPGFMDREAFDNLTANEPWSSKDHLKLAKWLEGQRDIIQTLMEACERDGCRFPLQPGPIGLGKVTGRLRPMGDWARLLIRAGNNDVGNGHFDKALEKYLTVIQIAKHINQQPMMINWLTGLAVEAMGIRRVNQLITEYDLTENQLKIIENSIGPVKNRWPSDWTEILETEILQAKSELGHLYEINTKGKVRLNRDPKAHLRKMYPEFHSPGYWAKKLTKSTIILKWFYFPPIPQKAVKFVNDRYLRFYDMAQPDFDWQQHLPESTKFNLQFFPPVNILPGIDFFERLFSSFHNQYLRYCVAQRRGCRLLVGIKRYKMKHGHWPDSLEDVKSLAPSELFVDPINNDSFVYRLIDDGFTLYSKGKNGIDENGDKGTEKSDGTETDDLLIWPPKSRKAKQ